MAGVLVVGEVNDGGPVPAALQVASAGATLAEALGEPFMGALIGRGAGSAAQAFRCGFASVYSVDGGHYQPYTAEAYVLAAQALIEASAPSVVLFAHGADTREWVPRLAARMKAGLVMDCTTLAMEGDVLVVTKPVNGGGVFAEFAIHGTPCMATVRASAFPRRTAENRAERIALAVSPPADPRVAVLNEETLAPSAGPRLKDAKLIVAGGRGVGGPDHWHYIEAASAALGAATGCSRPVADAGWVPSSQQVGLSGASVAPELYLAVGISGAAQHLAGITAAKMVVAINNSPDAEIFFRADYGIVEDYREVLPAFTERVKQLRASK